MGYLLSLLAGIRSLVPLSGLWSSSLILVTVNDLFALCPSRIISLLSFSSNPSRILSFDPIGLMSNPMGFSLLPQWG